MSSATDGSLSDYLAHCREAVLASLDRYLPPDRRGTAGLYELMMDYPLRPAKTLRPALCMAVCEALGGRREQALPSATALELFHNAALIHDDVEDDAETRRHAATLHAEHGVPIAVNVGDGMMALALEPLLDNVRVLGLGPALRILRCFSDMARISAEGQMVELTWIRRRHVPTRDGEYLRMVHKKTGWYSFIAPTLIGATVASAPAPRARALGWFALHLGLAFQIRDDLLSLEQTSATIGKDDLGDLWEGKLTLPLIDALRSAEPTERAAALDILARPRAPRGFRRSAELRASLLGKLADDPRLTEGERQLLASTFGPRGIDAADVERLYDIVTGRKRASLVHAQSVAARLARKAHEILERATAPLPPSSHKHFLFELTRFVAERSR